MAHNATHTTAYPHSPVFRVVSSIAQIHNKHNDNVVGGAEVLWEDGSCQVPPSSVTLNAESNSSSTPKRQLK